MMIMMIDDDDDDYDDEQTYFMRLKKRFPATQLWFYVLSCVCNIEEERNG